MPRNPTEMGERTELRVEVPDDLYEWLGRQATRFGLTLAAFVRRELIVLREEEENHE